MADRHPVTFERLDGTRLPNGVAVGEVVRRIRESRGWSQRQLDEAAGLADGHTAQIEGGRRCPGVQTLYRIASALGVSPSVLMGFHQQGTVA